MNATNGLVTKSCLPRRPVSVTTMVNVQNVASAHKRAIATNVRSLPLRRLHLNVTAAASKGNPPPPPSAAVVVVGEDDRSSCMYSIDLHQTGTPRASAGGDRFRSPG